MSTPQPRANTEPSLLRLLEGALGCIQRSVLFAAKLDQQQSGQGEKQNEASRRNLEARGGIEPPIKVLQTLSTIQISAIYAVYVT